MNMARYELIWVYNEGSDRECIEYENPWGYHVLMYKGLELTSNKKCTDCHYVSLDEWYWRDERGFWHRNEIRDTEKIYVFLRKRAQS